MPHHCISCTTTYADGSDSILSGCDECGGMTFQYVPDDEDAVETEIVEDTNEPPQNIIGGGVIRTQPDHVKSPPASERSTADPTTRSSRRSSIIDAEATRADRPSVADGDSTDADSVALDTLRRELNRQFEGIRVLRPGQYEINLARLFERDECIIALQEDGRYVISIPGQHRSNER